MTRRQFYELPAFVAGILARQPLPPRRVPVRRVIRALLGGVDCLIYFGGGLFFIGFGLVFGSSPDTIWGGIGFLIVGLLTLSLGLFRIWQVERALRLGDAELAEVTEAQRGRARLTGTPWGDLMTGVAARGGYRLLHAASVGTVSASERADLDPAPQWPGCPVRAGRSGCELTARAARRVGDPSHQWTPNSAPPSMPSVWPVM
jgi:hypothetical protein